jgi:fructokinase
VGAGDAFSAVLILGILEGWPLQFMLDRAREFAEAVVGLRGATSVEPAFYTRFRTTWSPA